MKCNSKRQRSYLLISWALILFITACVTGTSHFRRSNNVSDTFESFKVLSEYQYYYNGSASDPDAIVGVSKQYVLNSPHWHSIELNERKLRRAVEGMLNNPGAEYNTEPNGAYIYNDQGDTIGIWYSVWRLPILKFVSEREFTISRPFTLFPHSNTDPENRIIPFSD